MYTNLHMLTVLGLSLNGIGALVLVFTHPPIPAREVMEDGREKIPHTYVEQLSYGVPSLRQRVRYLRRLYGFRAGVCLLAIGFLLQLVAEALG